MPHDSPLLGGDTPGSDEGSKKLNELMELCTKLFDKVISLEKDLKQTKKVYGKALTKLVKKVKYLEDKLKSTIKRRKTKMVISDEEDDLISADPSKQGRMSETEYDDIGIEYQEPEYELDQTTIMQQPRFLQRHPKKKVKTYDRRRRSTDSSTVSTAGGLFSTAEEILCTDERLAQKLNKEEKAKATARKEQERIDFAKALELQKQLDEREVSDNIDWNINMAGYKMNYFKGMSFEDIRPMFEEDYRKLQTLFQKDTEVEKTKTKRVAEETLLQESFKKLNTAGASSS
ncbi:hypothetical protein Tco_0195947 [Tanacetum coccineum]